MRISVITPVLNDSRVGRALDSVHAQRFDGDLESIVVDGGSSEPTIAQIDRRRGRVTRFVSEPDEGIYDAMNKGIRLSTGDVVGILNADDRYQSRDVLAAVEDVFADSAVMACYGDVVYVDSSDRIVRYWRSGQLSRRRFYFGWVPPHPTFFVRRQVYLAHGSFDVRFRLAADYELLLRLLLKLRLPAAYIPKLMVRMALGGASSKNIGNIIRGNLEARRAWAASGLRGGTLAVALKPVRKLSQFVGAWSARIPGEFPIL